MTFDNHSLDRLKELGRKLPKEISKSEPNESRNKKEIKNQRLHPVEVETDPQQLFRELMEISQDGNVPPHLLERLKEIESISVKPASTIDKNINKNHRDSDLDDSHYLYTQFKQFLLEGDID